MQVQGIATIDRQPDSDLIVIWLTKRTESLRADHTNAVTVDVASDPRAMDKVRSLTCDCAALATGGSVLDGLPVEGEPRTVADIEALVAATAAHQRLILEAVRDHKRRTRSASLKDPSFPSLPTAPCLPISDGSPSQRTLATANYAAKAWTAWLRTDEERRRRTVRPTSGETPWMMPDELNSPEIAPLPEALMHLFRIQTAA